MGPVPSATRAFIYARGCNDSHLIAKARPRSNKRRSNRVVAQPSYSLNPEWKKLMAAAFPFRAAIRNQILAGLPSDKYRHLFSNLRPISLRTQEVLYNMEDHFRCVYFINDG